MRKFNNLLTPLLFSLLLGITSCKEIDVDLVTCPDESLVTATVTDDIYYDIYSVILHDILTDEKYLMVLQQTDSRVVMTDIYDDLKNTGMQIDSVILKNFESVNPKFADQQLDPKLETSRFRMLAEKEFQCLRANEQYDAKYPDKNKIVLLTVPGISVNGKEAFMTYSAFCDKGCGDSYMAKLELNNNQWKITLKVKRP